MSNLTINHSFSLDAPPETVWRVLIDPERIVTCLPGAELIGQTAEGTYEGSVKIKLGAVTMTYGGTAVFEETDHEARSVRITGSGKERAGSGNVTMTMEGRVEPSPEGGALVTVDARIRLAGKIVRFGRGMIHTVTGEVIRDFTTRLGELVVGESEAPAASGGARAGAASGAAERHGSHGAGDVEAPGEAPALSLPSLLWRAFKRWVGGLVRRRA